MQNQKWYTRKRVLLPVTAVIALLFGTALGAGTPPPEAKAPEPKVVTETKVVTKEKEVKVKVVPKVCLQALESAEEVIATSGEFANVASEYIPLIPRAAEAGMTMDSGEIESITGEMEGLNEKIQDLTVKVTESDYIDQSTACRAAS